MAFGTNIKYYGVYSETEIYMATKRTARKRAAKTVGASVLTKEDADRFEKSASAWGKKAARTKKSARETLVSLGIVTPKGRLTKKYG